jgi:hypothetical protein
MSSIALSNRGGQHVVENNFDKLLFRFNILNDDPPKIFMLDLLNEIIGNKELIFAESNTKRISRKAFPIFCSESLLRPHKFLKTLLILSVIDSDMTSVQRRKNIAVKP